MVTSLRTRTLFGLFILAMPALYAQTYTGRHYMAESPVSFQAFVYPDAQKPALKIRLENQSSRAVHIRIMDKEQKTVYDEFVSRKMYFGRLDISALPYGAYTIEMTSPTARHIQRFRIEPPTKGRAMVAIQPVEGDSVLAKNSNQPKNLR